MAKPIKETPVLKGKDARTFLEKIQKSSDNRNTTKENVRIRENFNRLNSIAKF
jgi:hypothetical protein